MSNELQIKKLNNAFGIRKLNVNNTSNSVNNSLYCNLIYAANGLFKTSFSKTMYNLANELLVEDRITSKHLEHEMYIDGMNIKEINLKEKILVFTKDLMDEIRISNLDNELSELAVVDELIIKIKAIYEVIDKSIFDLSRLVTSLGYDESVLDLLNDTRIENKLQYLKSIVTKILSTKVIDGTKVTIDKKLFSTDAYAKLDNSDVREKIADIIDYTKRIQKETIFDDDFTVFSASEFLKNLKQNSYLSNEKQRGIVLKENTYYSYDDFESDLNEHISNILKTPESKAKIEGIFKTIGNKKKEEKQLRKDIIKNQSLIEALQHSRSQWIANELIVNYSTEISNMSELINIQESEIIEISKSAESSQSEFEKAIEIHEDRFNPIFKVVITNRINVVLGIELPIFEFTHNSQPRFNISEDKLTAVLSSGEHTAYNVLKFIVIYERIKNNRPIVILDDVVDSFDYGNRYAFIEYIKDMTEIDDCNVIVLTNNFDFFRNLKLRARKLKSLATTINQKGTVTISSDRKLIFSTDEVFNIDSNDKLIVSLPFAREIANYQNIGDAFLQYFHYKRGSKRKTIGGLAKIIQKQYKHAVISNIDKKAIFINKLDSLCQTIVTSDLNSFDISPKVILALGIRLKLEKILICNKISVTDDITENQTAVLFNLKKSKLKIDFIRLVNKILVSTPEFIHLNAFMYEPLIDILPITLKRIYEKLQFFESDLSNVWKK